MFAVGCDVICEYTCWRVWLFVVVLRVGECVLFVVCLSLVIAGCSCDLRLAVCCGLLVDVS